MDSSYNVWTNNDNCADQNKENVNFENDAHLNQPVKDVVVYISGFVQKKLLDTVKCAACVDAINILEKDVNTKLIDYKKFNSDSTLIEPKKDIVTLCKIAEKEVFIFNNLKELKKPNFLEKLILKCFKNVPKVFRHTTI